MKRLETIANIAVIVAALVLVVFVGRQEWERHRAARTPAERLVGTRVQLPGIQFGGQNKTLVIAISANCHFCRDSEPFYKQLVAQTQGRLQVVAVLPQPQTEAENYVHNAIAPSVHVVSSQLNAIGVIGTPTLLLVDGSGKVRKAWVGFLDAAGRQQMQAQL